MTPANCFCPTQRIYREPSANRWSTTPSSGCLSLERVDVQSDAQFVDLLKWSPSTIRNTQTTNASTTMLISSSTYFNYIQSVVYYDWHIICIMLISIAPNTGFASKQISTPWHDFSNESPCKRPTPVPHHYVSGCGNWTSRQETDEICWNIDNARVKVIYLRSRPDRSEKRLKLQ